MIIYLDQKIRKKRWLYGSKLAQQVRNKEEILLM